jgi:hypothetical protein
VSSWRGDRKEKFLKKTEGRIDPFSIITKKDCCKQVEVAGPLKKKCGQGRAQQKKVGSFSKEK